MQVTNISIEKEKAPSMLDVDNDIHEVTPENKMFLDRLMELVSRVDLGMNCRVRIGRDHEVPNGRYYFQIACWRMDVITKKAGWGYGGKAYLSPHMTDSELFQIMFGLYKGYWEHEARENFEVDGVRPFGPHISTEALISVARKVDVRSAKHVEDTDSPMGGKISNIEINYSPPRREMTSLERAAHGVRQVRAHDDF